jgi:hypothetical protein
MAHGLFPDRVHFAESFGLTIGQKDRVETKPLIAPHRPDDLALDLAFEDLVMPIGPREA